jgi:hypothetical protein
MKISNRDWIQLSTYLDGELSRKETDQISRRIKNDPALQAALEELRITKDVLSASPELRVPRNFTLSSGQVGIKPRRPVYRKYQLAAALMSFLLIGVLVLDFGRILTGGAFAPGASMAEQIVLEKAAEDSIDAPVEEPALMAEAPPEEGDRSTAEDDLSADGEEAFLADEDAPETEEMEGVIAEDLASEAEAEVQTVEEVPPAAGTQVGEAKTAGEESEDEVMAAEEAEETDLANLASPTATPVPSPYQTQPPAFYAEPGTRATPPRQISPLRVLEIIFLVGGISFGITAWVLKRKRS